MFAAEAGSGCQVEVSSAIAILLLWGTNSLGRSFRPGTVSSEPDAESCKGLGQGGWGPAANSDAEQGQGVPAGHFKKNTRHFYR